MSRLLLVAATITTGCIEGTRFTMDPLAQVEQGILQNCSFGSIRDCKWFRYKASDTISLPTEQGIILAEQGLLGREQGILSAGNN